MMLETIKLYLHCVIQFLEIGFLTLLFFFGWGGKEDNIFDPANLTYSIVMAVTFGFIFACVEYAERKEKMQFKEQPDQQIR